MLDQYWKMMPIEQLSQLFCGLRPRNQEQTSIRSMASTDAKRAIVEAEQDDPRHDAVIGQAKIFNSTC